MSSSSAAASSAAAAAAVSAAAAWGAWRALDLLRARSPAAPAVGKHMHERMKPALNLLLVRHAESANNVRAREAREAFGASPYREGSPAAAQYSAAREPDPPLSALGERQALALRRHPYLERLGLRALHAEGRVALFCSPLERAVQTGDRIAESVGGGARLLARPDLCERGGVYAGAGKGEGALPGRTRRELQEAWPRHDFEGCAEDGWWAGISKSRGFEDADEFEARMDRVVEWLRGLAWAHRAELRRHREDPAQPRAPDHVVVVAHADFLSQLLARLLRVGAPSLYPFRHDNASVTHVGLGFHRRGKRDDDDDDDDDDNDGEAVGDDADEHERAVARDYVRGNMFADIYCANALVGLDRGAGVHV